MLLMMGVCARNMLSWEYIHKITLLHQIGISYYFMSTGILYLVKNIPTNIEILRTMLCFLGAFLRPLYFLMQYFKFMFIIRH